VYIKVVSSVSLHSECTRALTFENFSQSDSKSSSKSKSKSSKESSSKDKDAKGKKSSSKKSSSTSSKVSKSSLSSKAGSRSSDEELDVSSDDLADVDIGHDLPTRPRTGGSDRPAVGAAERERPWSAGDSSAVSRPSHRRSGFDPLTPPKEGNESEQSPGPSHVLSFFREDDARKDEAKPDLDALSSDLSDILGVSMKPARVGRRRAVQEEEAKLEKERQERQESEERRRRAELLAREEEEQQQREQEQRRLQEEERLAKLDRERREKEEREEKEREKFSSLQRGSRNLRDSPPPDDQVEEQVGGSSFAEDSPPLSRKESGARPPIGRHLSRSISPAGKEMRSPTPEASPGAAQDSLAESMTSVNFEESADAEEVMRMLEQGPMTKQKEPASSTRPTSHKAGTTAAVPAHAITSSSSKTTTTSSSSTAANAAGGGGRGQGGESKGGESSASPAGYVPFEFGSRQPRQGRRGILGSGSTLPGVGGTAFSADGRTSPGAVAKDLMRAESPVLSLEARLAQRLGQTSSSAQNKGASAAVGAGGGAGTLASPKPPRSPSPGGASPKLDGLHAERRSPVMEARLGSSELQAGSLLQRRGQQQGAVQLLSVASPVATSEGSNPPSTSSSASKKLRAGGGGSSAGDKGRAIRRGSGVGSGDDSWGAEETEAALAKVKELEQKAAQEERKRKEAEERARALSSQSFELMRGKEEKEELARALELQMRELAQARQADALRSSREIEAATVEDMKARKALEDQLDKERALRQESLHKVEMLEQEVARVKARADQAESAGGLASQQQVHLDRRVREAEEEAKQISQTNASLVAKVSALEAAQIRLEEELQAAGSKHTKAVAALKHEHFLEIQSAQNEAANLKSEVLRLQGELDRARDKAAVEQQDSVRAQVDHVKQLNEREKEWKDNQHRQEVAALTARYESRIQQLQAERSQGQSLESIMQTVASSAQQVRELGQALEHERATSLDEKEAAYRVGLFCLYIRSLLPLH